MREFFVRKLQIRETYWRMVSIATMILMGLLFCIGLMPTVNTVATGQDQQLEIALGAPTHFVKFVRHEALAGLINDHFLALWLNDAGSEGWAVGVVGEKFRFENGRW